jgi:hypothetical protein
MVKYVCYYLEDGRTHSGVELDAADDAAVFLRAEKLLADSRFAVMEIRQGRRFVGRVTLGSPATLMDREGSGPTPEPR